MAVKPKIKYENSLCAEMFPRTLSKSERTQLQIIEAAILCYSTVGLDKATYEKIAEKCGISRTLVNQYFPDRAILSEQAIKLIRSNMQKIAISAIQAETTPEGQLKAYVESTFRWIKDFDSHFKVWLLFYYFCGISPKFRETNTELVNMGHERISSLISRMPHTKALTEKELKTRAKKIQYIITGALVSFGTERSIYTLSEASALTVQLCLDVAKLAV